MVNELRGAGLEPLVGGGHPDGAFIHVNGQEQARFLIRHDFNLENVTMVNFTQGRGGTTIFTANLVTREEQSL